MEGVAPMGPKPVRQGGPEVLIGGYTPKAVQRAAQWDGYIAGGAGADQAAQLFGIVRQAWQEAGRQGSPRFVCATYFGLGENAAEGVAQYIGNYYAFLGPMAEQMASLVPSTPEALKAALRRFEEVGADELILWPCIPTLDQVDRLQELV